MKLNDNLYWVVVIEEGKPINKQVDRSGYIEWLKEYTKAKWFACPIHDEKEIEPIKCMFCPYGHMLECHYPDDCQTAKCSKFQAQEYMEKEMERALDKKEFEVNDR